MRVCRLVLLTSSREGEGDESTALLRTRHGYRYTSSREENGGRQRFRLLKRGRDVMVIIALPCNCRHPLLSPLCLTSPKHDGAIAIARLTLVGGNFSTLGGFERCKVN